MAKMKNEYLGGDFDLDKPFEDLGKLVKPKKKALSGELGDEMLDAALGRPHKKWDKPKTKRNKGLFDL